MEIEGSFAPYLLESSLHFVRSTSIIGFVRDHGRIRQSIFPLLYAIALMAEMGGDDVSVWRSALGVATQNSLIIVGSDLSKTQ